MAAMARGEGPSGFSFDAIFTTSSRPSSRFTSSTGLPGTYGSRRWMCGSLSGARIFAMLPSCAAAPECLLHGREQVRWLERLRHVAGDAHLDGALDVAALGERREHDHRYGAGG